QERRQVVEVRLAASGGTGGADLAVDVQPRAENRRGAGASRNLPRQAARRRDAADLAFRVHTVAVDRAPEMFTVDQPLAHHLQTGVVAGLRERFRLQTV